MDTSEVLAESWTSMYKDPATDLGWMDDVNISSFRDGILMDIHKYKTRQSEMSEAERQPVWFNEEAETHDQQYTRSYPSVDIKPYSKTPTPVIRHEPALKKPPMSYANMAALALKNSQTGELPVKDIYKFMIERWPYYKNAPASWKNSLRHNLSMNDKFMKREISQDKMRLRNLSVWFIAPDMMEKVDHDLAMANTSPDYEEDYEYNENNSAAAAIASSPVARAEGRPYKYTPRGVAQRPSFTFKPATQMMHRPSSSAASARPPSEISLFDSPAPQARQRAPMSKPALVPTYPTGKAAPYGLMRSPPRAAATTNSVNGRAIRDASDLSLFDSKAAHDLQRVRMNTPSIHSRKRPAGHPGNTGPPAKASYGVMRPPSRPHFMPHAVNRTGIRMRSPLHASSTLNSINGGAIRDPNDICLFGSSASQVRRVENIPVPTNSRTSFIASYSSSSTPTALVSNNYVENMDELFQ